ncbi:hypothetical protein [Ramlibacter sp. PS4R-6]|uniref:hypothetical protein n=1 Tax=Ramlibacter sp. PS4R-6 TaxID=3133438 RepID=UPI00309E5F4E
MNTNHAPQPLLSAYARIAGGIAAVAIIAVSSFAAGQASHVAVGSAQAAMHPSVMYVNLQPVEIVGRRDTGTPVADAACPSRSSNI